MPSRQFRGGGAKGALKSLRVPQIAHLKEVFRGGVNPASGSIPAGSRITIRRGKVHQRGRRG